MKIHARLITGDVACNGCTRCCHGDAVRLLPGDNPADFKIEKHPYMRGAYMLAHKKNGKCFYLDDNGCSIHDRKPQQCREMDCRVISLNINYTQARKMKNLPMPIWRKGRELLSI